MIILRNTNSVLIGPHKEVDMKQLTIYDREAIEHMSNTIETLRCASGLSINALATEAEISCNTLKSILRKKCMPTMSTLLRLCDVFHLSLWRFFLIMEGEDQFGHQNSREMLELFEQLQRKHQDLLLYIAKELVK